MPDYQMVRRLSRFFCALLGAVQWARGWVLVGRDRVRGKTVRGHALSPILYLQVPTRNDTRW
jgi:hypothetical protein